MTAGDYPTSSPAVGDDDTTLPGGDDDTSPAGDDDASVGGDDDASVGGDDDASVGGDDDASGTGDDDASAPGDDDASAPGDDDATVGGDDDASVPGEPGPIPPPPLPPGNWTTGVMLVSDTGGAALSLIRMADSARLWQYPLNTYMYDRCSNSRPCQVFEAEHVVHDDRDYVDFTMSSWPNLQSSVHRVPMDDREHPAFSLTGLDFSSVPAAGCSLPPSQTCSPTAQTLPSSCNIIFAHGFRVVQDEPSDQKVSLIITDTQSRILQIDLDYANGNKCGQVQWVMDFTTSTWEGSCQPNNVEYIQDIGNEYLGITCRNLFGSMGEGQIQLFRGYGSGSSKSWRRVWTYPDPYAPGTSLPYLNVPHHAQFLPYGDGSYYMSYAHSDGLGFSWGMGDHGTMGSAYLPTLESQPDYIQDEGVAIDTVSPRFGFLKSVTVLPGGQRLVTDSGSYSVQPPVPGSIYVMGPQVIQNNSMAGYWDPQHSQQNMKELAHSVERVYSCNWPGLYEAQWLGYESFGSYLRSVISNPGDPCVINAPPSGPLHVSR